MKILVAEYALAAGLGGTYEIEGQAMLQVLAGSFERCGNEVIYPTSGPAIDSGQPVVLEGPEEFEGLLASTEADAGLVIAPDVVLPHFLEVLESSTVNLGCSPKAARLAGDKLECTRALEEAGVPVVPLAHWPEPPEKGCHLYVIKPRYGCGSQNMRVSSSPRTDQGYIATRHIRGSSLSASFVAGEDRFLPLTINRQLIDQKSFEYRGGQVPYHTPRAAEIWSVAEQAAEVLGLQGYAGIDLILGDRPRVVDVNPRPTTSIIGIARVMREELGDLILKARYGGLPSEVHVEGEWSFTKDDLG
ncbi:MAG: ATP-grasp domain-containing protein [Methanosarcinales archaeon]|nr:ATP-grasp domain-containing protein [Methanosarcinales archaeon]